MPPSETVCARVNPIAEPFSHILSFQGRLAASDGKPLPDGPYTVKFRMYDSGSGGAKVTIGGVLNNSGYVNIGNSSLSSATTVNATGLVNSASASSITISGSGSNQATLDIADAAGFGTAGRLDGYVGLNNDALLEFASGGITEIDTGGNLQLSGPLADVASAGVFGANSALTGLDMIDAGGQLALFDNALTTTGDLANAGTQHHENGGGRTRAR